MVKMTLIDGDATFAAEGCAAFAVMVKEVEGRPKARVHLVGEASIEDVLIATCYGLIRYTNKYADRMTDMKDTFARIANAVDAELASFASEEAKE